MSHRQLLSLASVFVSLALANCILVTDGGGGGTTTTTSTTWSSTWTTSTTTTSTGSCVGETGARAAADCKTMNIAPESGASSICGAGNNEPPPGYGVCLRGFQIWTAGAASNLRDCLALVGVQNACDIDRVQTCVDGMWAAACDRAEVTTFCDGLKTQCGTSPFDATQCKGDMRPFSTAGMNEMVTCMNAQSSSLTCQQVFDVCSGDVLSY